VQLGRYRSLPGRDEARTPRGDGRLPCRGLNTRLMGIGGEGLGGNFPMDRAIPSDGLSFSSQELLEECIGRGVGHKGSGCPALAGSPIVVVSKV